MKGAGAEGEGGRCLGELASQGSEDEQSESFGVLVSVGNEGSSEQAPTV